MAKFLTKFVEDLEDIVDQLTTIFPKEEELKVLSLGIHHYKKKSPDYLAKEYFKYIYKYKDLIEKKDIQSIMNLDLSNDLKDLGNSNEVCLRIDYFKKLLESNVSKETKNNFLGHLKKLNDYILLIDKHEKSVNFY